MQQIDAFMDELNPNIEVIWGVSDDNSLEEDAKVTILATGFENAMSIYPTHEEPDDNLFYENMMMELYHSKKVENSDIPHEIPFTVETGSEEQTDDLSDENDDMEDEGFTDTEDYDKDEVERLEDTEVKTDAIVTPDIPPTQNEINPKPHHMTFVERVKKKMFDIAMEMTSDERSNS